MKATTLAVFGVLTLLCNLQVMSQNPLTTKDEATARLTRYEIKQEYQEPFRKALSDYVRQALSSESNIMAEAYYEQEDPTVLWLIERWISKKEMDKFGMTIVSLNEAILVKPARVYAIKDLEPLTKRQWRRTAKTEDQPLTVMLFVDAKKGTQQRFKTIYHKAMPQFRSEPGVVTYQISEIEGDNCQFVTYEKFRNKDAFTYHLNFPPIRPVVRYLETSIKKTPFQQGLHNLIEFAPLTRE